MLLEKDYKYSDNTSGRKEEMENPGKGQLKALSLQLVQLERTISEFLKSE